MSRASRRGLTLIEIALAVSILAVMGTLTYGSIARSFDAYEAVTEVDARYHNARTALNRMAYELSMAFIADPQQAIDEDDQWKTIFKGEDSSPIAKLHFTSFSHVVLRQDAKESDQSEISYYGEPDEDDRSQMNLMRREDPRLDDEPEKGGRAYVLAENVKSLKIRYYDDTGDDWESTWDTEEKDYAGRLPSMVEIKLTIGIPEGDDVTFTTKARLFMPTKL